MSRTWGLIGILLIAGGALRIAACALSSGIVMPDEHQQYLEVAQGIVYGPQVTFWEQEEGVRHYAYPGTLAGILFGLDRIGVERPIVQAATIRAIIALAILGAMALLAWDYMARGMRAAALLVVGLASLDPDFIFMNVRTLSETAVMTPLVLDPVAGVIGPGEGRPPGPVHAEGRCWFSETWRPLRPRWSSRWMIA